MRPVDRDAANFDFMNSPKRARVLRGGQLRQPLRKKWFGAEHVESAVRQGLPESPWEKVTARVILVWFELKRYGLTLRVLAQRVGGWVSPVPNACIGESFLGNIGAACPQWNPASSHSV